MLKLFSSTSHKMFHHLNLFNPEQKASKSFLFYFIFSHKHNEKKGTETVWSRSWMRIFRTEDTWAKNQNPILTLEIFQCNFFFSFYIKTKPPNPPLCTRNKYDYINFLLQLCTPGIFILFAIMLLLLYFILKAWHNPYFSDLFMCIFYTLNPTKLSHIISPKYQQNCIIQMKNY